MGSNHDFNKKKDRLDRLFEKEKKQNQASQLVWVLGIIICSREREENKVLCCCIFHQQVQCDKMELEKAK